MTIMEIGVFSGFSPDKESLIEVTCQQYFSRFWQLQHVPITNLDVEVAFVFVFVDAVVNSITRLGITSVFWDISRESHGKQWRRRKVKSRVFKLHLANIPSLPICRMLAIFFWCWILKDCIEVGKRKRKSLSCVSTSFKNREIRHFHVVVVQWRQRNVQKSVQSCCFVNLKLLFFFSVLLDVAVVVA